MQSIRLSDRGDETITSRVHLLFSLLLLSDLVCCDVSSGSGCNKDSNQIVPLSPLTSLPKKTSGLFLSPLDACGKSGCVSGWSFCFYSVSSEQQTGGANVTFSLWKWSEGGRKLEEKAESRLEVEMKTLPEGQWLSCEQREFVGGCQVEVKEEEEDLMVGVLVHHHTSLYLLGEVEEGVVMVGGADEGRSGVVSNSSLFKSYGKALLVSPVFSPCSSDMSTTNEMCSGVMAGPQTSPSPAPTTGDSSILEGMGEPELYLLVVVAGLGLVILVLLTILLTFLCLYWRRRKKYSKHGPPPTVLLNSDCPIDTDVAEERFDMHVLDTASSTHSTNLSPTPNGHPQVESNLDEKPQPKKAPPPIKPKPASRKKPPSSPQQQTKPVPSHQPKPAPAPRNIKEQLKVGVVEPVNRASLMRSYSEEAIRVGVRIEERPQFWMPRSPRLQRRLSTGCLPTPCVDEDDYTIPSPFLERFHIRPQPYLLPSNSTTTTSTDNNNPEYSYAYSHVFLASGLATMPRSSDSKVTSPPPRLWSPPVSPDQRRASPKTTTTTPLSASVTSNNEGGRNGEGDDDYDEIFVDKYLEEQKGVFRSNHTHSHTSSSQKSQLHSTTSHTSSLTEQSRSSLSHTPSLANQGRLMSNASDDGYVNSDEYPRPSNPAPGKPHPQKGYYMPLKPRIRKMSSFYEVPRSSNSDISSLPGNQTLIHNNSTTGYDHLNSDLSSTK